MKLGAITHPHPLIDQKVKFFHDCFHYWLLDGAKRVEGFPENHLTYLERMRFRGEVLLQMHQSSRMAICAWLNQPEFDTKKDEFAKKETIKPLVKRLKIIASQQGAAFDLQLFRETVNELIFLLNGQEGLNGSLYFQEVLKSQVSFLTCVHELEKHEDEIMKHSKWLVAEYMRQGFDAKEHNGIKSVFRQILKFEELKTSKKPHQVGFPLPSDLEMKRNTRSFKKILKNYLAGNSFLTQFEGMLHALQETQRGEIVMRINNIRISPTSNFEFKYGGVTFQTFEKIKENNYRFDDFLKKDFEDYFGAANTIIARIPIAFKSKEQAINKAKYQINTSLDALHYILNEQGGQLDSSKIIIADEVSGAYYRTNSSRFVNIGNDDVNLLSDFKQTIPYPEPISQEIKHYLDRCSRIFFKGLSCENPDDMISHFWQYWETSFGFGKYKKAQTKKGEQIINDLSLLLANEIAEDIFTSKGLIIHNYAINNNGDKITGIPSTYYGNEFDWKDPGKSIQEIKSFTDYPFLKMLIRRFEKINKRAEESRWHRFYQDFLWQLYEQRNFIAHDGTYCPATLERLQFFFRIIVTRWQSKLFEALEKVPGGSVEDAVLSLLKRNKV